MELCRGFVSKKDIWIQRRSAGYFLDRPRPTKDLPPPTRARSAEVHRTNPMSAALAPPRALSLLWRGGGAWRGALEGGRGLLDWVLRAVPKKRTTHAKKRMRMSQKYLKPDASIRRCQECGAWKRAHTYCLPKCAGRRDGGGGGGLGDLAGA